MKKAMDKESLLSLCDKIINKDDQVKIATLSDELTISQVVKFFDRQNRNFTKTMIQNYVRVGLLPPPFEKRYYTKNHLILLALIDNLKEIYTLEEIKAVLQPIRNNPEIFEDDIIKVSDIYNNYLAMRKESLNTWKKLLPDLFDNMEILLKKDGITGDEINKASAFMIALTIMANTVAMKDLIREIINEYIQEN
ncbi:MAG TPA: DUF1836 domain-containing protein [Clostridiaceae bacterium]|nr:DUF1836 domain-containing protein [Clostridiaceae bacterium]